MTLIATLLRNMKWNSGAAAGRRHGYGHMLQAVNVFRACRGPAAWQPDHQDSFESDVQH